MKISIFISSIKDKSTGYGGHYRSLLSYYNTLKKDNHNVSLLHYSQIESTYLDNQIENEFNTKSVSGWFTFIKVANSFLKKSETEVILSFSRTIYSLSIRVICYIYRIKFIQVIPGGPNINQYLCFKNCIYFSVENKINCFDYTKNKFIISNRVDSYDCSNDLISCLESEYRKSSINILRVSRINIKYMKVFISAINLHEKLLSLGLDVQTHLIGIVEDMEVYSQLQLRIEKIDSIYIIVDPKYTNDVKKIMDYYDIVIGIGRGFWEGIARNKLTLGYASNLSYPTVISANNIYDYVNFNFSPRIKDVEENSILNQIDLITNQSAKDYYITYLYDIFQESYSSNSLSAKICNAISSSTYDGFRSIFFALALYLFSPILNRTLLRYKKNR